MTLRPDLQVIAAQIAPGARVLDVGCGDGTLMAALQAKECDVRGLELDAEMVERCVARGLSVMQGDAMRDLADYPDKAFDVAVLSQTLQTARRPADLLDELLRIAASAFVSFPNFAHWRVRCALLLGGRMPVTDAIPVNWYDTPNIHHLTVADFREFARGRGLGVEREWFFARDRQSGPWGANWRAEFAVFLLSRGDGPRPAQPSQRASGTITT